MSVISVLWLDVCMCVWLVLFLFFFFFKQKTAYEMRISDWSSDVCSSDLSPCCPPHCLFQSRPDRGAGGKKSVAGDLRAGEFRYRRWFDEIGRASCRERVCQYV